MWMTSVKEANFAPVNFNASGAMSSPETKGSISPAMQQQPYQQTQYQQGPAQGYPPAAQV